MRRPKSHSRDNQRIRSGIFYFFCLLALLEGARYGIQRWTFPGNAPIMQVDSILQATVDSLRRAEALAPKGLQPFNPNYLNDYRGYRLGLSAAVLDSVYAFRKAGGILTCMDAFAKVTGLTPGECRELLTYFRFPEAPVYLKTRTSPQRKVSDLNRATTSELQQVRGIGPVLSERILKFRKALGGFLHESQLFDVYGLDPIVARRAINRFKVVSPPEVKRIQINTASEQELAGLLYLTPRMAADIVAFRDRSGPIESAEELSAIESIPREKIDRIALYLQF